MGKKDNYFCFVMQKTYKGKSLKLGGGGQFAKLTDQVAAGCEKKGMSPVKAKAIGAAVAAKQGRKKLGIERFAQLSVMGKKRAAKK